MEAIQSELQKLESLEKQLSEERRLWTTTTHNKTNTKSSSSSSTTTTTDSHTGSTTTDDVDMNPPTNADTPQSEDTLLQRYEQARNLYLQRRLESLLVEHLPTFEEEEIKEEQEEEENNNQKDTLTGQKSNRMTTTYTMAMPHVEPADEEEIQTRRQNVLQKLQSSLSKFQQYTEESQSIQQKVQSQRQKVVTLLENMKMQQHTQNEDDSHEDRMEEDGEDDLSSASVPSQEQLQALQQQKHELQQKLEAMQAQTKEVKRRREAKQKQLKVLQDTTNLQTHDVEVEDITEEKLQALRERKEFYENLTLVMEELGGVKIQSVTEYKQKLHLSITLYEHFQATITLETHRKVFLKVVEAQWSGDTTIEYEDFKLSLDPLDDLVQVAKATLGPPHDLRFVVREALARIRILQQRVQQLGELRKHVLTKVHNGNQVVCSLNDGIVIVLRLYEHYVHIDQIVGVGGWDAASTQSLREQVQKELAEKEHINNDSTATATTEECTKAMPSLQHGSMYTPLTIVQHVQQAIEAHKNRPQTPRFPVRKTIF